MITPAEFIGVGRLWEGGEELGGPPGHPPTFAAGSPMGQHLTVERLIRITEDRMIYMVNNLSRKWHRKKCWACGNKYSPDKARCCSYCGHALDDLRFLMTTRFNPELYPGFEELARARTRHFGLIAPVYAFYRHHMMMAVYHYDGGALLVDTAAPLAGPTILRMGLQLSETLAWLHGAGVVLRPFKPQNVLLMPDMSSRLFDIDVLRVARRPAELYRDPSQPILRDTRNLGTLIGQLVAPEDEELTEFFRQVAAGAYPGPIPVNQALRELQKTRHAVRRDPKAHPHAAAFSDLGLHRAHNEDAWGWRRLGPRANLYVVADGMGGHKHGERAARLAVETTLEAVAAGITDAKLEPKPVRDLLVKAVDRANAVVYETRKAENLDMGTTLTVALVVDGHHVFVAHVGDSRAYHLKGDALTQVTRDHTVAAELARDGQIPPEAVATHRSRNILTQAIGGEPEVEEVEFHHLQARGGDRLLLCTDGLHGEVPGEVVADKLRAWADRHKAVRELVRAAYDRGGRDNVSLIVVDLT